MNFYLSSSFANKSVVRKVASMLISSGFRQTYDWTMNQHVQSIEDLARIGEEEKSAIFNADFLILLLPGGKGSHIEFGIALGLGKRIYLYSEMNKMNEFETTSTFYHVNGVTSCSGSLDDLVKKISINEGKLKKMCTTVYDSDDKSNTK